MTVTGDNRYYPHFSNEDIETQKVKSLVWVTEWNGILTQRFCSKAHNIIILGASWGASLSFPSLWTLRACSISNLHTQHAHTTWTVLICTPAWSLQSGSRSLKASAVVSQCLTYDLVHSKCLLNGLVEESLQCAKTGEEAKTFISKGYFCINVKTEPLGTSSVHRAPWKPGLSYKSAWAPVIQSSLDPLLKLSCSDAFLTTLRLDLGDSVWAGLLDKGM